MTQKMNYYIFGSRILTHVSFWIAYYLFFGFVWARDGQYFESYFLEFILLPVRMLAVYAVIYWLLPRFLKADRYLSFAIGYLIIIIMAGAIQRVFLYYYYEGLVTSETTSLFSISALIRNIILVNSTVLFVTAIKIIQLWHLERWENRRLRERSGELVFEIRADKRVYRVKSSDVIYIESLGNYVTYHLKNRKIISYETLTDVADKLPANFSRIHKSYIVNKDFITSYNAEEVEIEGQKIPIGRSYRAKTLV